jgi:fucose permease
MTGFQAITAVCISGAFVVGMVFALLPSLRGPLSKRQGLDEAQINGLFTALSLALIPMMFLSGALCDVLSPRIVLIAGGLLTAAALLFLPTRPSYFATLFSVLAIGLGGACISAATIVLMPLAFFGKNTDLAASLNLGNVFFGLGALVTPALIDLMMRGLDLRRTLGIVAAIFFVPVVLASVAPSGQFGAIEPQSAHLENVFGSPLLWLAALVFLLYGPLEWSVSTWAIKYLTDLGYRERRAALVLAGFWLAFLGARLLTALWQHGGGLNESWNAILICVLAIVAAIALGDLAGAGSRANAGFGLILLGAALGPIFPTLVALLFKQFPSHRGTAYGAMFGLGSVGSLFLPRWMDAYARRKSVQYALRVPNVVCWLLFVASLLLALALAP